MFRYLNAEEYEVVRERATAFEGQVGSAGRTAIGIMLGLHGLRCAEVCGVCVKDLDSSRGALHVDTLKQPRTVGGVEVVDLAHQHSRVLVGALLALPEGVVVFHYHDHLLRHLYNIQHGHHLLNKS